MQSLVIVLSSLSACACVQLTLIKLGYKDVFACVGENVRIKAPNVGDGTRLEFRAHVFYQLLTGRTSTSFGYWYFRTLAQCLR